MALTVYNTLTRRKEPFQSLDPGKVTMYCCGVTVYDYCHLGHARSYIVWDTVRRYLQWRGYQVHYAQNFTDIDDKILNRANAEGSSMEVIVDRYITAYFEDIRRLNVIDANEYPRVTEHISAIHQLIESLQAKNYAYAIDGDVYYKVRQFSDYGKLSGRQLGQLQAGASDRVETEHSQKQDPFDFALWKAAKPGEPAWDSPWGKGRPGWHIECSAMIRSRLGDTIDIHGGGGDLVFPHHENEIAQSEVVTGKPLANYWLHNGMVTVNGEKMSKSLGNFTTIRELLDRPIDPMVVRLFVLQAHYRKPLDFTEDAISAAQNSWQTLKESMQSGFQLGWQQDLSIGQGDYLDRFRVAMDDDFNTSEGLAILFELAKSIRRAVNVQFHQQEHDSSVLYDTQQQWQTLIHLANVLGLETTPLPEPNIKNSAERLNHVEDLIQQRQRARQEKRFADADRLRKELQRLDVILVDSPSSDTHWHFK